jgi:C-terminal processing protease CtpA/Prc
MAISMSRRERTILIVTIVVGAVALVYRFGLQDVFNTLTSASDQLAQEEKTYREYIQDLKRKDAVDRDYQKLERSYSIGLQGTKEFTGGIEQNFAAFGMTGTRYDPPEEALVEGAEDYGYVKLRIRCDGEIEMIRKMLTLFDKQALLVEELKLTGQLDFPRIGVDVRVSQIVKTSPEMRAKMEKQPRASGTVIRPRARQPVGE